MENGIPRKLDVRVTIKNVKVSPLAKASPVRKNEAGQSPPLLTFQNRDDKDTRYTAAWFVNGLRFW